MNPDTIPNPTLPEPAAGAPAPRRNLVGRIGLVFSSVAVLSLLMMYLLQPG